MMGDGSSLFELDLDFELEFCCGFVAVNYCDLL